jgi:hypothetical protein
MTPTEHERDRESDADGEMREVTAEQLVFDRFHLIRMPIAETPASPAHGHPPDHRDVDFREYPGSGEEKIQRIHHQCPNDPGHHPRYDKIHHPSKTRALDG